MKQAVAIVVALLATVPATAQPPRVVIGCKKDTEGNVLGEMMAQLLEDKGFRVERRFGLGSTLVCFESLRNQAIDLYPEYSGTIEQEILKLPGRLPYAELQKEMEKRYGMELLPSFGFQNTYALAVKRSLAETIGLKSIGDLARANDLRYGFSHEFLDRRDGWPGLAAAYGLSAKPSAIAHGLAYEAIDQGKLDVTDVYSTDGDIRKFDLALLKDNLHYFPDYYAAPLLRGGLDPLIAAILKPLAGKLTEADMQRLNEMAVLEKKPFAEVANTYLADAGLAKRRAWTQASWFNELPGYLATHLRLTAIAVLGATVVAIPLGVLVYLLGTLSRPVVYLTGVIQTIPSIALLAFMIPVFGIGEKPAIVALLLYALLPILRNTTTALALIDPVLRKVAVGMGLTVWQRLRYIELPLAAPAILAGIKTAAVITIGTATLAAFIGAGGLGQLIVTGLEVKNPTMVLEGAVPAALLAVFAELGFEWLEKWVVPQHLRQIQAK